MRFIVSVLVALALASTIGAQITSIHGPMDVTTWGQLQLAAPDETFNFVVATCDTAGPDPEDLYDCKISDGHSFNEVMRVLMRQARDAELRHEKLVKDYQQFLERDMKAWHDQREQLEKLRKQLEGVKHTLDHDSNGRT